MNDLKTLAASLLNDLSAGMVVNQKAITGMGGLGKTQLAVEFAYRYGHHFRGVHWLNLADPTFLDSEIARCGLEMNIENFPDDQPSQVVLTLNTWKSEGPRLLVLDNFEDVEKLNNVLPRLRHSNLRLLITSRHSDWPRTSGLSTLQLELFVPGESLAFLKNSLENRSDKDADLATLAERLGHLPLALELASRYLNGHPRLLVDDYLAQTKEAFNHPSMKDWRKDLPAPTQHDLDLQRTFGLSWETLKDETPKKLFMMAGYLAPNTPIPPGIFEKVLGISADLCDENILRLYGLGLMRQSENNQPAIHPLLAEYARSLAKQDEKILKSLVDVIGSLSVEANQTGLPNQFAPLRSHISILALYAEGAGLQDSGLLWNEYGLFLKKMIADFVGARAAYESSLRIYEQHLGSNHEVVATLTNNLAGTYYALGDLNGARTMYERALKIHEAVFGSDHRKVAIDINNLGNVLKDLGDYISAKDAFERAVKIWEAVLNPDHPDVAVGVNNLAGVLQDQGDLDGARTMYERALKIDEAIFGSNHPRVAIRVNNLGLLLKDQGDLDGARTMYERALKICENSLGAGHPQVAIASNNLGLLLKDLGDLNGARTMFERALKIWENNLGAEHPQVATGVNNLGLLLKDLGDFGGAYTMLERALKILKQFLPPDHPNIKIVQNNLESLVDS